MNNDNTPPGTEEAGEESAAARLRHPHFGAGIVIGAGFGLIGGLLFGDMLSGMVWGAGFGIVVDAVRNLL